MSDVTVIDNFLDSESFKDIQETMMSRQFPWYWGSSVVYTKDTPYNRQRNSDERAVNPLLCDEIYDFQFTHMFFQGNEVRSKYYNNIVPLLNKLECTGVYRIKANLNPVKPRDIVEHEYHVDNQVTPYTSIFYLNSNDGYTAFKDGTKIESVENRMVTFKTSFYHTGSSCTDQKRRVLINFNYYK